MKKKQADIFEYTNLPDASDAEKHLSPQLVVKKLNQRTKSNSQKKVKRSKNSASKFDSDVSSKSNVSIHSANSGKNDFVKTAKPIKLSADIINNIYIISKGKKGIDSFDDSRKRDKSLKMVQFNQVEKLNSVNNRLSKNTVLSDAPEEESEKKIKGINKKTSSHKVTNFLEYQESKEVLLQEENLFKEERAERLFVNYKLVLKTEETIRLKIPAGCHKIQVDLREEPGFKICNYKGYINGNKREYINILDTMDLKKKPSCGAVYLLEAEKNALYNGIASEVIKAKEVIM